MENFLKQLYKRNDTWLSIAFRICRNKQQAEDIVQEMYLKIALKGSKKTYSYSYIYQIIKNIYFDFEKKNKSYFKDGNRVKITFVEFSENNF